MAQFNPYAMDPALAQGFSNLSKALIGDAGTDLEVARRKRLEELLPLELKTEAARANQANAAAAASNSLATLNAAKTLTEEQLRDPRVQKVLAEAQAQLAAALSYTSTANLNDAKTDTERALLPGRVETQDATTQSKLAEALNSTSAAGLNDAKTDTERALLPGRVETQDATTQSKLAEALNSTSAANLNDAKTDTEVQLRPGELAQQNAALAKTEAETSKLEAETELTKVQTATETQVTLPAGHTLVYTDENGERQMLTAPDTQVVTLSPGEVATVIKPDQTRETIEGPPRTATSSPADGANANKEIDRQVEVYLNPETGSFPNVDASILKRIRSSLYNDENIKGKNTTEAAAVINELLSQTRNGATEILIRTGFGGGPNFYIPAFVANAIADGLATETVMELYGLSREQVEIARSKL